MTLEELTVKAFEAADAAFDACVAEIKCGCGDPTQLALADHGFYAKRKAARVAAVRVVLEHAALVMEDAVVPGYGLASVAARAALAREIRKLGGITS